jgi:hypothetical protein
LPSCHGGRYVPSEINFVVPPLSSPTSGRVDPNLESEI